MLFLNCSKIDIDLLIAQGLLEIILIYIMTFCDIWYQISECGIFFWLLLLVTQMTI